MTQVDGEALAGSLTAHPGLPLPTLSSTRREWAAQLARGQPAQALPGLLSSLYSLCGGAHRVAARRAVAAALDQPAAADSADERALQADTLREHLRRIWLDWPRVLPVDGSAADLPTLAACPLLRDAAAVELSRGWVEQQVLGMSAPDWLAQWEQNAEPFVTAWAEAGATWPARWLHRARALTLDMQWPGAALAVHASRHELAHMASQLRDEPGFALCPLWRGQTAETGPWTRLAARQAADGACQAAFMRLAWRVADVAHLVAPQGERWLALGSAQVGPREGLAWCEMARGLLLHWVQLEPAGAVDAAPRVAQYHVLAPTEWNFHPHGTVACLLSGLPRQVAPQRVQLLAAAFDPCVELSVAAGNGEQGGACTK